MPVLAVIFLILSLTLFISAVYIFDRLSMPEGFWVDQERPSFSQTRLESFRRDLTKNGPLYAYMIRTWDYVFTPAVIFAFIGFVAILLHTELWWLVFFCLLIVGFVFLYYRELRPKLGTD